MTRAVILMACLLVWCAVGLADEGSCLAIDSIASMARAKTTVALLNARRASPDTYRAQLVFAYRAFELRPGGKTEAEHLHALIPTTDDQRGVVLTLGDLLCDGETGADELSLSRVRDGIARNWSEAVILAPQFMPRYVRYSLDAVSDPHSDYAIRMEYVCKHDHAHFMSAVKALANDRERFK